MKVGRVFQTLSALWEVEWNSSEKTSVLLLGAPGVGKSTVVREVAEKFAEAHGLQFIHYTDDVANEILANPEKYFVFVDLRLTEIEAADLSGIPRDIDGAVTYKPLLWARVLSKAKGVLFLDELTNESDPNKLAAAYKIILDRAAGFIKFSDGVFIVAAGNSPEHSAVANQLPAPLINRLLVLEVSAPSIDEWRQWMMEHYGDQWDVRTYAFLKAFEAENYLLRPPEDPETLRNYPTPRSWTKLALMLKRGFDDPEIINGLIGPEVGTRFRAFINTNVNVDDLIKNPEKFHGLNLDQKYMASIMLSSRLKNAKDFKKAMPLFREMHKESPEFVIIMLLIMDRKTRAEAIRQIYQLDKDIFSTLVEVVELKQQAKA
jgi:galactitol-specific phosphotransferase system IIB component